MVTLDNFIKEEVNEYIKGVILNNISEGKSLNKVKEDLVFNRYSLELFFSEGYVIIYDDVFSNEDPVKIQMDDFLLEISKVQ